MLRAPFTLPLPFFLAVMTPGSRIHRCLRGSELPEKTDRIYARNLEIAAGGGVGTARAAARAYGEFATGGKALGLREENRRLRRELAGEFRGMIGDSPPIRDVAETIRRAGPTDATVLVTGESGTGKELAARALHAESRR